MWTPRCTVNNVLVCLVLVTSLLLADAWAHAPTGPIPSMGATVIGLRFFESPF
jgi:hypothetical protein